MLPCQGLVLLNHCHSPLSTTYDMDCVMTYCQYCVLKNLEGADDTSGGIKCLQAWLTNERAEHTDGQHQLPT